MEHFSGVYCCHISLKEHIKRSLQGDEIELLEEAYSHNISNKWLSALNIRQKDADKAADIIVSLFLGHFKDRECSLLEKKKLNDKYQNILNKLLGG